MDFTRTNWVLIALLWLAGLGAAAQFGKVAVTFQDLQRFYATDSVTIGLLVSVVGFVGVIFGASAGLIVTRFGNRKVILTALAMGAAVSFVQAMLPPLLIMFVLRIIEGFSHLALVVAAPVLISQVAMPKHQNFVMILWSTFFGVSFALLAWIGPILVSKFGLQSLFLAHGSWFLGIGIFLLFSLKREAMPIRTPLFKGLISRHIDLYRSPFTSAPGLGFAFYTMTYVAVLTILPGLVDPIWRVFVATAMPLVSIAVSLTFGVWVLRYITAVQAVMLGFAGSIISALFFGIFMGIGLAEVFCAVALAGFLGLIQGASFACIPALNPEPNDRAKAAGVLAQMGNVGTSSGTPILAYLAVLYGGLGAMWFVVILSVCGILMHAWLAGRRRRASTQRVE